MDGGTAELTGTPITIISAPAAYVPRMLFCLPAFFIIPSDNDTQNLLFTGAPLIAQDSQPLQLLTAT